MALNKAIAWPGGGLDLKAGDLTPGLAFHIANCFHEHNVQIAVLGCYINLSHPDPAARAPLIAYFKNHLRYARDFGSAGGGGGVVATETGSLNPDWSPHPDNHSEAAYRALVPVVADLVEEAERCGRHLRHRRRRPSRVAFPAKIRRLLDDIRSSSLQVLFDPVNLLSVENFREQDRIIQESFDLFGERIAIIHAKDFAPENLNTPQARLLQLRTGAGRNGATPDTGLNYPLL